MIPELVLPEPIRPVISQPVMNCSRDQYIPPRWIPGGRRKFRRAKPSPVRPATARPAQPRLFQDKFIGIDIHRHFTATVPTHEQVLGNGIPDQTADCPQDGASAEPTVKAVLG